jgi:hypothetical protein
MTANDRRPPLLETTPASGAVPYGECFGFDVPTVGVLLVMAAFCLIAVFTPGMPWPVRALGSDIKP